MSDGISTAYPPAPPGRGPVTNNTTYVWQYRGSSGFAWQELTNLPGVTADLTGVTVTGLTSTAYDGYQFRMIATATQTLQNPPETITTSKITNLGTLRVNTQVIDDGSTKPNILSVQSLGEVTDTLPGLAAGPRFRLRTSNSVGRTVNFSSTTNTDQFGTGGSLVSSGSFVITSDDMIFHLVSNQNGGNGGLRGLRRLMPEQDTLTITGLGTGWATNSASTNYIIRNGGVELSRTIFPGNNIDEGQSWTVNVAGANVPSNMTWSWQTEGYDDVNDVLVSAATFPMTFEGDNRTGSVRGSFQVKTLLSPTHYENKAGTIKIYNQNNLLYTNIPVNIRNIDSITPNITLSNLSRSTSVAWFYNKTYSGQLTLGVDGTSIVGNWGTGIPDSSKITLSNIRHAPGSPFKSLTGLSTNLNVSGTTSKTLNYSIGPISGNSGDPFALVIWTLLTDVRYDNVFIGTFTTTINFRVNFPANFN